MNKARITDFTHKIYKHEITNLKEMFYLKHYPKEFVDDVIERSMNINIDCTKKKLSSSYFKNIVKVQYIGKSVMSKKMNRKSF